MRICPECGARTELKVCPADGLVTLDESIFDAKNPLRGRKIAGKYLVLEEIGAGAMGAVYRARHVETGGFVALKVMAPSRAGRPTAIKRFHLEAQNAAALAHANTVRVLDFGVDDDLLFLVMEFLEGEPLSSVLRREGPLAWVRAVHICKQILKALWEAHEHPRKIIHRDIKAANIFLCRQVGDPDFVKVVDFGVARSMESAGAGTHGAIGTPGAMAPEQWQGGGDARSDLYSVGCLLYEMLVGHSPFVVGEQAPDKLMQLAHMHMHEIPASIRTFAPNVPLGLARLAHSLLQKHPEERPQSARETILLLDKCLYGDVLQEWASAMPVTAPAAPPQQLIAASMVTGDDLQGAAADETVSASVDHVAETIAPDGSVALPFGHVATAPKAVMEPVDVPQGDDMLEFLRDRMVSGAMEPMSYERARHALPSQPMLAPMPVPGRVAAAEGQRPTVSVPAPLEAGLGDKAGASRRPFPLGTVVIALLVAAVMLWGWRAHQQGTLPPALAALWSSKKGAPSDRITVPAAPVAGGGLDTDDDEREAAPLFVYRARLGERDHKSAKGKALRSAIDVIVRDRENFHAGQQDVEDGSDNVFGEAAKRRALKKLLRKAMSRKTELAIIGGRPLVEVQVWSNDAAIAVIAP